VMEEAGGERRNPPDGVSAMLEVDRQVCEGNVSL
jgi:hypothetical protein